MTIAFSCECGQTMEAKEEHAGRRTSCPKCGREVTIPSVEGAPPPGAPARPEGVASKRGPAGRRFEDEEDDDRDQQRRRRSSGTGSGWIILLVLGIVGAVSLLCIVPILIGLLLPAIQKVREAAGRVESANNLKQISLGLINYADANRQMPPAVVYDKDGKPLYSWRVLLLPYVEEGQLYNEFHLDEPWDSPHNKPLLARMPSVYTAPTDRPPTAPYATHYLAFDGPGAAFNSDKSKGLQPFTLVGPGPGGQQVMAGNTIVRFPGDFRDGTSNTFLVVEAADAVPWSSPADLHFNPNGSLPKLGGPSARGFNAAFADGSVKFLPNTTDDRTIRALITIAGGENVLPP
jgi:prepilin-type processing-associated H-X9-DG protein